MDAAPCNAAQGDVAQNAPERDAKTLRQKATVPGENALAPRQSLRHTIKHKRKRGPESPLFLRPRRVRLRQEERPRPSAAAAAGADRRTRRYSHPAGIPRAASAPHDLSPRRLPLPGGRASFSFTWLLRAARRTEAVPPRFCGRRTMRAETPQHSRIPRRQAPSDIPLPTASPQGPRPFPSESTRSRRRP